MSRIAFLSVTLFILGLAATHPARAAEAPRYNHVRFQVESSRPVDNDRMQAVLSTTAEDDNAARLADTVNRTMDWAMKTAKARPRSEVRSGGYHTYPVYDKACRPLPRQLRGHGCRHEPVLRVQHVVGRAGWRAGGVPAAGRLLEPPARGGERP